ncbi:hypothetical protein SD71_06965 [Cohnella kolymensis]|uniref:Transcriptional regulator n=1 Tax=Cohnella kolymensis TaxID=1590652 RepID=A0ABR5A735_9BACL|nr:hypothetical protein [Cohnella kolymensis]KIL36727.1 hypothetical protein SD71_06965 [Cohnella kolymensis]
MYENEIEAFVEAQQSSAGLRRLEMLHKDLSGTKKLLGSVLLPIVKTFEGITLEHEMLSMSGMKIFGDVYYEPLGIVFEAEGFVPHAENITRDRFSFEKMRIRTIQTTYGFEYIPFSWDDMDKKPETCIRAVYELFGRLANREDLALNELPVYEREVLRFAIVHNGAFHVADACLWLQLGRLTSREIMKRLEAKELIAPVGGSEKRCHAFRITDKGKLLFLGPNRSRLYKI